MHYLSLLKQKLGLNTNIRDEFLSSIIESVKLELENVGIQLGNSDSDLLVIDYAYCAYREIEPLKGMEYRKRCLIMKYNYREKL